MTRFNSKHIIKMTYVGVVAFIIFFCQQSFANQKQNTPATDPITTSKAIDEIQKTLISSETKTQQTTQKSSIVIDHSSYGTESKNKSQNEIEIVVANPKINRQEEQKQKLAHKMAQDEQYEVAIELYKQILKSNPKNHYAEFSLASCYHLLGQYSQAKAIYYKLLKYDWQDQKTKDELINNFISLIVEESPSEAVYLLKELSNQNPGSDYIIAGAAMAYDKINQPDKAILLLKKAININPQEIKYKFNLAVIYDKIGDYKNALNYYQDAVNNYISNQDLESLIPIVQTQQRIKFLQQQTY